MRRLAALSLGTLLAGTAGYAQDPVKVSPKSYRVLIDNPQVRVLGVAAGPGEKTAMHEHPENITILLTDGRMTFTDAAGTSETVDTKAGQAMASGPQKHMGTNAGASSIEAIVVEFKGPAAPKATLPATRPNLTRTALVETPRADAIRFTADASFQEAPGATHDYDQLLIALGPTSLSVEIGGQTKTSWKRGDVLFIGRGQPHLARNTSGKPQDMIVVAIK